MSNSLVVAFLPFLRWFPLESWKLRNDLIAGITVALVLVPQSMAYAQLAGLPVVQGLYASLVPVIIAALWGSSSQLHTGPVAMLSLMSAAAVLPLASLGSQAFIELSVMLALMVGVLRLLLGLLRMGVLVNFLSTPVITGFTNAAALIIGLSQLSKILNVPFPRTDNFVADLWAVFSQIGDTHLPTLLFAVGAFGIIFGMKRIAPKAPGVLIAVVVATLVSWAIGFERNAQVTTDAIDDAKTVATITAYQEALAEIDDLSQRSTNLNESIRFVEQSDFEDAYARLTLLEAEREVLRHKIDSLKRLNNEREIQLHGIRFKRVVGGEAPRFYPSDAVPKGVTVEDRAYRIAKVDADGLKFMGGGAVVGNIPPGLPPFEVPPFQMDYFWALLPSAFVMALIGFMEATSISKAIAAQTRERVDTSKELVGQGLANIVGSFFSSYTVSGSFSRSAVNARTGAKTGMAAIFSAVAVMIVLLFLTPLLYHLPQAVLAVIVMMAVFGLINVRILIHAWRVERQDAIAGMVTFVATLAMAPALANGILLGVGLTVLLFLIRTMRPRTELVARHPDGTLAGSKAHGLAPLGERFVAVRFDGSLNFVNASHFEDMVLEAVASRPEAKGILVIGSGINYVDASGEERIRSVIQNLKENGIELYFSSLKRQVVDVFRRGNLFEIIDEGHLFRTKEQALAFMYRHFDGQDLRQSVPE